MTFAQCVLKEIADHREQELHLFCKYGHLPTIAPMVVKKMEEENEKRD